MNIFTKFPLRLTTPLVLGLLLLLAEGYTITNIRDWADTEEEREGFAYVSQEMTQLQDSIAYRLRKGDWEGVESAIAVMGTNPNVTVIALVDDSGTVIGATSRKLVGTAVSQALPDADTAIMKEVGTTLAGRVLLSRDRTRLAAYYPVTLGAKAGELRPHRVGTLYMRYDLASAKARRRHDLERQALIMAGFYAGCFLILGLFLRLVFTKRVNRLVTVAGRFAAGDLAARTSLQGKDELAEIGAAFDRMAERIARDQQALRESMERLTDINQRLAFHITRMPLAYIVWDKEFRVTEWNPAAERIFGWPAAEALGKHAYELIVPPEVRPHVDDVWKSLLEGDTTNFSVNENITRDGTHLVCEWYNTPVRDAAGGIAGVLSMANDVTERKRAEEALAASEARFRMLFENSPVPIWEEDFSIVGEALDGLRTSGIKDIVDHLDRYPEELRRYADMVRIIDVNRAAVAMHNAGSKEELMQGLARTLTPDSFATLRKEVMAIWNGETEMVDDAVVQTFSGTPRYVTLYFSVCPGYEQTFARVLVSLVDITERKNAETELRRLNEELEQRVVDRIADLQKKGMELSESQRALMNIVDDLNQKTEELEQANAKLKELDRLKSMFVASMSHELRTPLNSIIGFSSVLLNEWVGPVNAEQKENLAIILRSGKHLLNLINDVIDVSKIEAGKVESATEEFDLHDLVDEGVSLVKKELEEKGLALRVEAAHQRMRTDRRRLLQCLLNLLSNAVKFTERGSVTVETRIMPGVTPEEAVAEIAVTDTGFGIREEDLARMFQPFVRLAPPGQATVPGTGLGLYLTRKLAAEILKGDIILTSEYGRGSQFTIRIPVRIP